MESGLTIRVVDPDPDYLGIEIRVWNDRFDGATRIYAGLEELSEFAARVQGFPQNIHDERRYEFGQEGCADGYCGLHFRCIDPQGHAIVELAIEDFLGSAQLSIRIEAAAIDRFTEPLRAIERDRTGVATLSSN